MKIAVTTPTGKIGSKLTERLLSQNDLEVVLLARTPEKLTAFKEKGAVIRQGDQLDAEFVKEATKGVDALFWVNPPKYDSEDYFGYYRKLADNAAAAIKTNNIPRTVFISSVGAHLGRHLGVVNAFKDAEETLRATAPNLMVLRPTFFMENFEYSMQTIVEQGSIFMPISGDRQIPMIATADIAETAADYLTDYSWTGVHIKPLFGPKEYSFDEAAGIIGKTIGQDVDYVSVSPDDARRALMGMGMSEHSAGLMVGFYEGIDAGYYKDEQPRSPETTTPTTFEEFVKRDVVPTIRKR